MFLRFILLTVGSFFVLPSSVNGSFIIDPFTNGTLTSTPTASGAGFQVDRVVSGSLAYNSTFGVFELFSPQTGMLTYTVSTTTLAAPTFGEMALALTGSTVNGFSVGAVASAPVFDVTIDLFDDGGSSLFNGTFNINQNPFPFTDPAFEDATSLKLTFTGFVDAPNVLFIGGPGTSSLNATPEPTSLVLFATSVGLGLLVVRRKKLIS